MIHAFPKIFALGTDYIQDIWLEEVEITEKIDGSQFVFGKQGEDFFMRSKGKQIFPENVDNMFAEAADVAQSLQEKIPANVVLYGEYLKRPKHNVLAYDRTPRNHIMLYGATMNGCFDHDWMRFCHLLNLEPVPMLIRGEFESQDGAQMILERLLNTDSVLGGCKIEGVVVKNYGRPFLLGGQPIPLMMGKFVSEKFKEKHQKDWKKKGKSNKWEVFKEQYRTAARWLKAVQHLRDNGELENAPRDIGKLIREIQNDIKEEELDVIKDGLWKIFGPELIRKATAGFPEWYKEYLLKGGE